MRAIRWWLGLAIAALHGTLALAQTAPPVARPAAQLAPRNLASTPVVRLDTARMRQLSPRAGRNLAQLLAQWPPAATLSVWDGRDAPPSEFFRVVPGPVTADRNRHSLNWYFRFETGLKPARATYQVSLFPFPAQDKDPLKSPGLVAQGAISNVPKNGGLALFSIDFTRSVRGRPWAELRPQSMAAEVAGALATPGNATPRTQLRPDALRPGALRTPTEQIKVDPGLAQLSPRASIIRSGYYVRVLLQRADGSVLGAPSNAVQLSFQQLPPQQEIELVMGSHPPVRFAGYRPVQPDDWAQLCIREYIGPPVQGIFGGPDMFTPGQVFDACAKDDGGFLDDLSDALGDFFGALGDLVDSVGQAYEWAKSQAVALAASALDQLGVPCPCPIGSCEVCLSAALDYGLASLGIPPTLPSFDELVDQGVDYMAATIAAETGLPAAEAMAVARKLAESSNSAPGAGGQLWRPLPQHLYAPLVLKLGAGPSKWPVNLVVDDPSGRYQQAIVPLPALARRITVPVALQPVSDPGAWRQMMPTLDSLPGPGFDALGGWMQAWINQMNLAAAELELWRQRYRSGPVRLKVSTLSAIGSGWSRQEQLSLECAPDSASCNVSP